MPHAQPDLVEMQLRDSEDGSDPESDMELQDSEPPPLPAMPGRMQDRVLPRQQRSDSSDDHSATSSEEQKRSTAENQYMRSKHFAKRSRNPQSGNSETDKFRVLRRNGPSESSDDRVISSFQEQKHWISSVLTAASAAGEETVRFQFAEDKHLSEGCAACGPDFSNEDFELSPNETKSPLATQIWSSDRPCLWLQSCCWKFYNSACFRWLFRGNDGDSEFPKIEPAQKFRCGWKMLQERACVLAFLFLVLLVILVAAFPVFLRYANYIQIACVDYRQIQNLPFLAMAARFKSATATIGCHEMDYQDGPDGLRPATSIYFSPMMDRTTPPIY